MKPASGDPSVVLVHGHIRQQAAWEPTRILQKLYSPRNHQPGLPGITAPLRPTTTCTRCRTVGQLGHTTCRACFGRGQGGWLPEVFSSADTGTARWAALGTRPFRQQTLRTLRSAHFPHLPFPSGAESPFPVLLAQHFTAGPPGTHGWRDTHVTGDPGLHGGQSLGMAWSHLL